MGKNEQKPAIRFQGFTDAWEQRKQNRGALQEHLSLKFLT